MSTHIINPDDFKDYKHEVILAASTEPRKRMKYVLNTAEPVNGTIELYYQIHVTDKFDNIVYTGNHLSLAIKAYNALI